MPAVLVIDDDASTLALAAGALAAAGFAVQTATCAREGLRLLPERRFDAVLLEVILSGKEGIETIVEIRRRAAAPPVVAMSGGGRLVGADLALSLARAVGAREVLHKPFTGPSLVAAVKAAMRGRVP